MKTIATHHDLNEIIEIDNLNLFDVVTLNPTIGLVVMNDQNEQEVIITMSDSFYRECMTMLQTVRTGKIDMLSLAAKILLESKKWGLGK